MSSQTEPLLKEMKTTHPQLDSWDDHCFQDAVSACGPAELIQSSFY